MNPSSASFYALKTQSESMPTFANAQIVGVVADFRLNALDRNPHPEVFWTVRQSPSRNVWIMARTLADPSAVGEGPSPKIQDFDPNLPVLEMQSMSLPPTRYG